MRSDGLAFYIHPPKYKSHSWEQRKLGEVLISLQNNTLSRADLSSEEGIAKNIHYGDILVKFGEVIDLKTESLPMIADETVIAKYKSSFLQNGDVIVADTAEDETVGKCTEIAGLSDEIVISGLHTIPYRPLQKYAPGYLGYYMNSASFHNQLLPLMQGIKVTSISKTALQNTDILYPKSATEQAAIGKYFRNLDNLITLHQRNSADFVSRFLSDFTNTWEQRKAVDIADYSKGNGYSKSDLTENGTPIILYGRLYTEYQFAIDEVDTFATPKDGSIYSQGNEVIIPASGETAEDIARASAVEKSGILLGGDLNILRPFNFINPLFLALTISNGEPQKELAKKAQGKSVVHIHNSDIQEVTVSFPTRAEQDRIVAVFRSLDNLITLHQRKLEKLQNIKKSMLEKMFV